MNPHTTSSQDSGDDALRWQLRAMRRDVAPGRDLWPGIAARLGEQTAARPASRRPGWLSPLAMAASVLLLAGTFGWLVRDPAPTNPAETTPALTAQPEPTLVQREAEGLTRQYQAALTEMRLTTGDRPVPTSLAPTIEELDRNAALIRAALERDPDSVRLLEQLRRTYSHRLALVQRLAYT